MPAAAAATVAAKEGETRGDVQCGLVHFFKAVGTHDYSPGWEIRPFDKPHQLRIRCVRVVDEECQSSYKLPWVEGRSVVSRRLILMLRRVPRMTPLTEIMRRDVSGHAHGDTRRAVQQENGQPSEGASKSCVVEGMLGEGFEE